MFGLQPSFPPTSWIADEVAKLDSHLRSRGNRMKTKSLAVRKPGSPGVWNCLTIRALPPFHLLSHGREAPVGINLDYPGLPSCTLEPNFNGVLSSKWRPGPCLFRFLGSCSLIGLKVLWEIPLLNNETTACGWNVETEELQSNPRRRLQTAVSWGPTGLLWEKEGSSTWLSISSPQLRVEDGSLIPAFK